MFLDGLHESSLFIQSGQLFLPYFYRYSYRYPYRYFYCWSEGVFCSIIFPSKGGINNSIT
jgi:hypothetical protein